MESTAFTIRWQCRD